MKILNDPRLWGAGAFAMLAILAMVAAMIYVSPPGDKVVSFYTEDASSITPGITVRIAGITVGTVKDLSIEPERVRVRATVKGDAFVGDQSTVQVRMLTVVGGYYVNIDSLGDTALGDHPITRERVTLPYSLIQALTDTTKITRGVATAPVNQTLDQVQQGLTGPNLESISSIIDAGTTLTETLDRQSGQLSKILNFTDEYIDSLANYRGQLRDLVRKVSILEQTLVLYGKGLSSALVGLGNIVQGLGPVGEFYLRHRDKFLARFIHGQQTIRAWADRSGLIVRILRRTRDRMEATLDVQQAPPELLATDLCIPLPESPC
ncbi:MlaD family protein [Mycolicibacterium hodleri]|uniref:MCE family protein n=1 Tax=Mycolicibacterium hodleri TaxID=49897 RepID=A0A502E7R6_9MYCO|nr:MlaD family protein [Mycolicibacterium hodleri]TPG32902.1 MCE family protein [Mycolicibacterium hodleri]